MNEQHHYTSGFGLPRNYKPRPLWKAVTYESLRLACVAVTLAAVVGIGLWLVGGRAGV